MTAVWTAVEVAELQHFEFPGGYSPFETRGDCEFNVERARQAVNAARLFRHVKGPKGGQPIELEKWQAAFIANLFGWIRPDGLRRYRVAYVEVPRGNGKSTLCVVIVGVLMYIDDEPGADIFSAAGTRDQAKEVFNPFKHNVITNPSLNRISKCYQNSVVRFDKRSGMPVASYKAIAADADFQHGGSPYGIVFDELHVQPNRELWDVLETGKVKRLQPVTVAITTAGYDRESICYEQHDYARKVIDGVVEDESFFPVIYAAADDDDWRDPQVWRKANPNLGVSIREEDIASACKKAQEIPALENTFKRLHLNIWTESETRAIPMADWDACDEKPGDIRHSDWIQDRIQRLAGCRCFGGLDLSSKTDVAALALLFPPDDGNPMFESLLWYWVPEENAKRRSREPNNAGRYEQWAQYGYMTLVNGSRIDQNLIRLQVNQICEQFRLVNVAFDPWNAEKLRIELEADGVDMLQFNQTISYFNEPTKELLSMVAEKRLLHGGDPVLRWMASNLSVKEDASGNMRPDKKSSGDKIDGMVALIMAIGSFLANPEDPPNPYENRPLFVI